MAPDPRNHRSKAVPVHRRQIIHFDCPCRTPSHREETTSPGKATIAKRHRRSLFSPAGRRWPEGPDEGAARSEPAESPPHRLASARHFSPPGRRERSTVTSRPVQHPPLEGEGRSKAPGWGDSPEFVVPFQHSWLRQKPAPPHIPRTRGSPPPSSISAVSAQTSASSRSGERPDDNPSGPKSHIWSSSAGNDPACTTRPCS